MAEGLAPGIDGEAEMTVREADTAVALGSGRVAVLATPALVALMEKAALTSVEPFLEAGQTTVGASVKIRHLSPTPVGMKVKARSRLAEVEGKKLIFEVSAYDEREMVGEGLHERYIVDTGRFLSRATKKENKR
ncbi:MAG: thioesterase family protein [Desulfotomaculales bacterium]